MKRRWLVPTLALIMVVGWAGTICALPMDVFLKETGVSPSSTGVVYFAGIGNVNVLYGEYDLAIDWDMGAYNYEAISGFCVENAYSSSGNGLVYELLDPALADPGGGDQYVYAAYIMNAYLAGGISAQAAQLAIWEAVLDPGSDNVLSGADGNVYTTFTNGYTTEANNFLVAMYAGGLGGFDGSGYAIARNPAGSTPPEDYQDYIIHIPDASTLLLLGSAFLVGFGALGRRKRLDIG